MSLHPQFFTGRWPHRCVDPELLLRHNVAVPVRLFMTDGSPWRQRGVRRRRGSFEYGRRSNLFVCCRDSARPRVRHVEGVGIVDQFHCRLCGLGRSEVRKHVVDAMLLMMRDGQLKLPPSVRRRSKREVCSSCKALPLYMPATEMLVKYDDRRHKLSPLYGFGSRAHRRVGGAHQTHIEFASEARVAPAYARARGGKAGGSAAKSPG